MGDSAGSLLLVSEQLTQKGLNVMILERTKQKLVCLDFAGPESASARSPTLACNLLGFVIPSSLRPLLLQRKISQVRSWPWQLLVLGPELLSSVQA